MKYLIIMFLFLLTLKAEEPKLSYDMTQIDSNIKTYRVKPGDTLYKIAKKFKVSLRDLSEINYIVNKNEIKIGDLLIIPISDKEYVYYAVSSKKLSIKENKEKYKRILKYLDLNDKKLKRKNSKNNLLANLNKNQRIYFVKEVDRMINERFDSDQDFLLDLIFAMIYVESRFNTKVIGDKNHSVGLLQLNKDTLREMKKEKISKLSDRALFNYLYDPVNNVEFALKVIETKIITLKRVLKEINKKRYINFIKRHSKKHKGELQLKYQRFFPIISLYNGGLKNYKYVDRVFKQLKFIE